MRSELLPQTRGKRAAPAGLLYSRFGNGVERTVNVTKALRGRLSPVATGLLADWSTIGLNLVMQFALAPVLLAILSVPVYGVWLVIWQFLFFINLIDGGANMYLIRATAEYRTDPNVTDFHFAFPTAWWAYMGIAVVQLAIGLSAAPVLVHWLNMANVTPDALPAFQLTLVAYTITSAVTAVFLGVMIGYEKLAVANMITNSTVILANVAMFVFAISGFGIVGLAWGQVIASTTGLVAMVIAVLFTRAPLSFAPWDVRRAYVRQLFGIASSLQLGKVAFVLFNYADGLLITNALGSAAAATFLLSQRLPNAVGQFLLRIAGLLVPGLTVLLTRRDRESLRATVTLLGTRLVRFGLLASIILAAINERFIALWVGPELSGGLLLTLLFAYTLLRNTVIRNLLAVLYADGALARWGWLSLVEAIAKIVLTFGLLRVIGLAGAALATALADLITATYSLFRVSTILDIPPAVFLGKTLGLTALRSIPTGAAAAALTLVVPMNWAWVGIAVIAAGAIAVNLITYGSPARLSVRIASVALRKPDLEKS